MNQGYVLKPVSSLMTATEQKIQIIFPQRKKWTVLGTTELIVDTQPQYQVSRWLGDVFYSSLYKFYPTIPYVMSWAFYFIINKTHILVFSMNSYTESTDESITVETLVGKHGLNVCQQTERAGEGWLLFNKTQMFTPPITTSKSALAALITARREREGVSAQGGGWTNRDVLVWR